MIFRAVTTADYTGVAACLQRNAMSVWSQEDWRRIWDEHPYATEFQDVPRGFVLEADGVIVGTISNLWAKYSLQGRSLRVAISGSAAVDPEHRGGSIKLMGETVRQAGVDLYLNGSPSELASKIMETLKVRRVPQPDYDVSLLWAVRGHRLALAGLRRRGFPLPSLAAWPAGVAARLASAVKLARAPRSVCPVATADHFSEEFDPFWLALRAQSPHLIGFRDRKMLAWRYSTLLGQRKAVVLSARRGGRLTGYLILVRISRPQLGLEQYVVHDVQVLNDDRDVTASLLRAAVGETRRAGLDLLEWVGHTGAKRVVAEHSAALRHRLNVWQAYYYTRQPALKQELQQPERWSFGLYDSD